MCSEWHSFFHIPPLDKEVPVEERNGDAHDETEQAVDEEEGGGEVEEGEEVVEDEASPAEVEEDQEEEENKAEEETDEVTDDTVNAARPESTSPLSIPGMLCLLCPSSSHHSQNALFFPPQHLPCVFFPLSPSFL